MSVREAAGSPSIRWEDVLYPWELETCFAMRVLACSAGEPGHFVFDLRCLSTKPIAADASLAAYSEICGEESMTIPVFFRSSREIASVNDQRTPWVESEYAIVVPEETRYFAFECTRKSSGELLGEGEVRPDFSDSLLEDYYTSLRNPFVDPDYPKWLSRHVASATELEVQRRTKLSSNPLISLVVPVYKTPRNYLEEMLGSLVTQTYSNWELVVVNASPDDEVVSDVLASCDDPRIRVIDHPENDGINGNTNAGIAACKGEYVGFIDHDDYLEPNALFEYVSEIIRHPDVDVLYSDEDSFDDDGEHFLPLFKPDFNRDLLYSNDYAIHLEMVSRRIIEETERSGDRTNGAQDYDLMLRGVEKARRITHIPQVLYHWRKHEGSTNAGNAESKPYVEKACMTVLHDHFSRRGIPVTIEQEPVPFTYRLLPTPSCRRKVSVIVDANGEDQRGHLDRLRDLLPDDAELVVTGRLGSVAAKRNAAARRANGELLLFLADDVMPLSEDAVDVMAAYFERPEVGLVGPQLLYPDGQRYCSGLIIRSDGRLTYANQGIPGWDGGYNGRANRPSNWTALSHAAQLVRRDEFVTLGGYSTAYSTIEYAATDLCLRMRANDKLVTYTSFARMSHSEPSQRRFAPLLDREANSLEGDRKRLQKRWPETDGWSDPAYNVNLDETSPYFRLGR